MDILSDILEHNTCTNKDCKFIQTHIIHVIMCYRGETIVKVNNNPNVWKASQIEAIVWEAVLLFCCYRILPTRVWPWRSHQSIFLYLNLAVVITELCQAHMLKVMDYNLNGILGVSFLLQDSEHYRTLLHLYMGIFPLLFWFTCMYTYIILK